MDYPTQDDIFRVRFGAFFHGGQVRRYHTIRTTHDQTVADHSWGVAVLASLLIEGTTINATDVLTTALTHDIAEFLVGDLPSVSTSGLLKKQEEDYMRALGYARKAVNSADVPERGFRGVAKKVLEVVKMADMLEGYVWSFRESYVYRNVLMETSLEVYGGMIQRRLAAWDQTYANDKEMHVIARRARRIVSYASPDYREKFGGPEDIRAVLLSMLRHDVEEPQPSE